jgi:hypothetical protein
MGFFGKLFGKSDGASPPDSGMVPPFRAHRAGTTLQGLWVKEEADTKSRSTLASWLRLKGASEEMISNAHSGKYRVVADRGNGNGGWLCLFDTEESKTPQASDAKVSGGAVR